MTEKKASWKGGAVHCKNGKGKEERKGKRGGNKKGKKREKGGKGSLV